MYKKINQLVNVPLTLSPREVLLGLTACAFGAAACLMTGVVAGMLISPRKAVTIGSYNGCNNDCGRPAETTETEEIEE